MEEKLSSFDLKWRTEWEKNKLYEANVDEKLEKKFITAAFPYPNSPQHIGHGRTYCITDVYVRYLRMKGYNVLFPMGFHVTGTPILAMAKKIKQRDKELIESFEKIYDIPKEKIFELKEPLSLVMYFSNEMEQTMKEMGYGIDWKRKFYTFDKHFNKFIEWQFLKLKELGYLRTGEHPVPWCPADNNAVSAHDTKADVEPELEEVYIIKFGFEDGNIIVSTYRPETLFGVTNIWINPNAVYVKTQYQNEIIYLAQEAAENLKLQFDLKIIEKIDGKEMLNKRAKSPLGESVPILCAEFVKPGEGTGIVMSVPAHAPYDYLALRDLGKLEEIGLIKIIELKGYDIPAKDCVERLGVKNQTDPKAEIATKEIYKKEIYEGKLQVSWPEYNGLDVNKAREKIKAMLSEKRKGMKCYILANEGAVFCRCGARIVVNIVKNQWFIDYGNENWKKMAKKCLEKMSVLPEKTREEYLYVIDWLNAKACVRAQGLGTLFPFEKNQIIESLSDSTIYPAFYTIVHRLSAIPIERLDEKFFDYVFCGKGEEIKEAKELRKEFLYWYPVDSRHSGADLIRNHLTFFLFNHAAIFAPEHWPKKIVVNGFVLMEGKKMSKSLGNILPLRRAIKTWGADVVRLSLVGGADLSADTNFSNNVAQGVDSKLKTILRLVQYGKKPATNEMDFWLISKLNKRLVNIDEKFEKFEFREIINEFLYKTVDELNWYCKRTKEPHLKEFFEKWVRIVAPFIPHISEEIWHRLGGKNFVVNERIPQAENEKINDKIELSEELLIKTMEDIEKILGLIKMKPTKILIFIADRWKKKAYAIAQKEKNFENAVKKCMNETELKEKGGETVKFLKQLGKNIFSLPTVLNSEEEEEALRGRIEFIKKQFKIEVEISNESKSSHSKAKNAMPGKPAIVLE